MSRLMGSRRKCWKWLGTMPSGWWTGEEAGRLAGKPSHPAGQVSLGSLFLFGAHLWGCGLALARAASGRRLVSPGLPRPHSFCGVLQRWSGQEGGWLSAPASRCRAWGICPQHLLLWLHVLGSGIIILAYDLAGGPSLDSLRPQIPTPHPSPRAPGPVLVKPPLVLPPAWGVWELGIIHLRTPGFRAQLTHGTLGSPGNIK